MAKRARSVSHENTRPSKKVALLISILLAFTITLALGLYSIFSQTPEVTFSLNAAIIDQLEKEFPNPAFIENVTTILKNYGFNVIYYNELLNVDFFKGLAKYNYGIILLRVHSALRADNSTVDLFTSEEYADYKYPWERQNGFLTKGELLYAPGKYYFAITSNFIKNLEGRFPKSIIFAMGCWSLKPGLPEPLAKAFIEKGAKAYIGWTDIVLPRDTDNETLKFLKMMLIEDKPLSSAISETDNYTYSGYTRYGYLQTVKTQLNFYPQDAGNLKLSQLITQAKTSLSLEVAVNNFKQSLLPSSISMTKCKSKDHLVLY